MFSMREAVYVSQDTEFVGGGGLRFSSRAWLRVLAWHIVNRMRRTITYATVNSKGRSKIRFLLTMCTSMWCCGTNRRMMPQRKATKTAMSVSGPEVRRNELCRR